MRWMIVGLSLLVGACDVAVTPSSPPPATAAAAPLQRVRMVPDNATQSFAQIVSAVEPVAEQVCRAQTQGTNCDFRIVVDPDRSAPPNASQSLDRSGRPVLTFNAALIAEMRNANELAFVMGHEAAHHIANHLSRQQNNAMAGAVIFAGLSALTGGSVGDIQTAQEIGAMVGARSYSKDFELEADKLGTAITYYAGYNPMVGARYFSRIPDPGDRFLGTHPPNAARLDAVRRTSASLGVPGA